MFSRNQLFSAGMIFIGLAAAQCQLENKTDEEKDGVQNSDPWCIGQGEGSYQFVMYNNAIDVPTFDGSDPNAGYVDGTLFIIYDNACNIKGIYDKPDDNESNCGIPYTIEDNYLPYVLTIDSINTSQGGGHYSFAYANGEYSIGNDGCVCFDVSHDVTGAQVCRCAFPVNGEPEK